MTKVIMTGRKVPRKPAASCSLFILMFGICSFLSSNSLGRDLQKKKKIMNNIREVRSGKMKGDYTSSLFSYWSTVVNSRPPPLPTAQNQQTTAGTLPILTAVVAKMLIAEGAANCHVVCVISECQSPTCTCHWWASLWIFSNGF